MNVKFEYFYRDSGNNKKHGWVVFENRGHVRIEFIRQQISRLLGDEPQFTASRVRVPDLFFDEYPFDPELDFDQHEFAEVSETSLPADDVQFRDIGTFLERIESEVKFSR